MVVNVAPDVVNGNPLFSFNPTDLNVKLPLTNVAYGDIFLLAGICTWLALNMGV